MKIYRLALNKQLTRQIMDGAEKRPFPKLFGDKKRILIPLKNQKLLHIVKLLEDGDTTSQLPYKVDLENKVAYRYLFQDGKKVLDTRPMRLGKVIFKELGKRFADEWSVQQNSIQDENYSIILSRDPIDVVRMSDHPEISSCHSPDGDYFSSAQQEAMNGGAVAYLVKNEDLNALIETRGVGEEVLQENEIFEDNDRRIDGIEPITRLRVNKYYNEDDNEDQIAIPVDRTYGADKVAGFFDSVKDFLHSEQKKFINYDDLDMTDYKRGGGDYADERDKSIMVDFFGSSKGVTRDLDHEGSSNMADLYNEELETIMKEFNEELMYTSVYANADSDNGYMNIFSGVNVEFRVKGNLLIKENYLALNHKRGLEKDIRLKSEIDINEINLKQEGGIVKVSVVGELNDIRNPDDFRDSARNLPRYEDLYYISDLYIVRDFLIRANIIDSGDVEDRDRDEKFKKSILNNIGGDIVYEDGIIIVAIPLNFKLKDEIWGYSHYQERDSLKNEIKKLFTDLVKRELVSCYEKEKQQMKFNFYNEDMSEIKSVLDYMPRFQISFSGEIEEVSYGEITKDSKRKMFISIPETELSEAGQVYFNMFASMLVRIQNEISRFIQYKYAEKSSVGYNKEWSKYIEQEKLPVPPQTALTLPQGQGGEQQLQPVQEQEEEVVPAFNKSWYKIAVKSETRSLTI